MTQSLGQVLASIHQSSNIRQVETHYVASAGTANSLVVQDASRYRSYHAACQGPSFIEAYNVCACALFQDLWKHERYSLLSQSPAVAEHGAYIAESVSNE